MPAAAPKSLVLTPEQCDSAKYAMALLQEDHVLRQGIAQRAPGEADTTFLKRLFPASFPPADDLVTYAWRPSPFGKQLFFSYRGRGDNAYGTNLYVLDPFQPRTYAVHALTLPDMGDLTNLAAFFFADVNGDGQKELLTLLVCSLRETHKADDGELLSGHWDHYQTVVFQHAGLDAASRPRYRLDPTPRPFLDELPTAAAVRRELTRHPVRPTPQQKK